MRIIFMGTPDFAVPSLQALADAGMKPVLCVSQPDRPQGRHQDLLPTSVKKKAAELGIPVIQPTKVKVPEFAELLRSYEPDLIVTAAYGRILTEEVLAIPSLGCINVHGSLLPKYRGASPVQAALIADDEETGITILRMVKKMDAGAILKQAKLRILPEHNITSLMMDLAHLGACILPQTILDLAAGKINEIEQNEAEVTYVKLLTKEDGEIQWDSSAAKIAALIRGTNPWPGAYTYYQGKRCKIHLAEVVDSELWQKNGEQVVVGTSSELKPGSRFPSPKNELWIQCGEGVLAVRELQLEGSKRQLARDVAHNFKWDLIWG